MKPKIQILLKKGYFENSGKVSTIKLKGVYSEGIIIPLNNKFKICDFNVIDDEQVVEKYIPKNSVQNEIVSKKQKNKLIVSEYFNFHYDTMNIKNESDFNLKMFFNSTNKVYVTSKLHGTSMVTAYLPCKQNLNIFKRFINLFFNYFPEEKYDYIWSSRKVIKSFNKQYNHFYLQDIWTEASKKLLPFVEKGMSIYSEIVGYLPKGGYIQKKYDYGCKEYNYDIYIYRITKYIDGKLVEYPMNKVIEFCEKNNLKHVPLITSGYFEDLQSVLKHVPYLEKKDPMCKNKVPYEGIVLRCGDKAYKYKCNSFLEMELKDEELNIEDEN